MPALVMIRPLLPIAATLWLLTVPVSTVAQDQDPVIDELVNEIIALRGEVDELDTRLQGFKKEHQNRMSSLAREEGQLAAERERQQLRLRKVEQDLAEQREALASGGVGDEELKQVLAGAIGELRGHVNRGLPFKRGERLEALSEMEAQLEGVSLPPARVANRLWSFVADEIRLSSETGLYRQSISVDGQDKLVDVARVGMMNLYFRTDDGRFGYAVHNGGDWRFSYVNGADRDRIENLMSSLRKQIRTGYFELPNPRPGAEAQ